MLSLNEPFKVLSEKPIFFFFPNRYISLIKTESNKGVAPSPSPARLRYPFIKNLNPPSNILQTGNNRGHSCPPDQDIN